MRFLRLAALAVSATGVVDALSPAEWRGQSIYQVLTDRFARTDGSTSSGCNTENEEYCGGSWRGIINKLDYIQGMGFTAVWISPVVEQVSGQTADGSSYHGYWARDINGLNANFGTAQDLKDLSAALHARGMYLMVDVVVNHMAYVGCGTCVDYSTLQPFNQQSYYHDFCLINYDDANSIKNCWMGSDTVSLPDLRTEDADVQSIFNAWITQLVADYSIDGLRLDSAQQVSNDFWPAFQAAAGGIHFLGEVFNGDPSRVCPYQTYMSGVLNFPAYYWVTQGFQSPTGSLSALASGLATMKSSCSDPTLLGSFLENHDLARFPSLTPDLALQKNAIAFTLLMDGIPIVYAGQEHRYAGASAVAAREATWLSGYDTAADLYGFIAALNALRARAVAADEKWTTWNAVASQPAGQDSIVLRKGNAGKQVVAVFTNAGEGAGGATLVLGAETTGFEPGMEVVDVLSCGKATVDGGGGLAVEMEGGLPRVFYPAAGLKGSGLCGSSE